MKKLLLLFCLITSVTAFGQNLICEERGHLCGDVFFSTLMYCPPYVEDYEDSTITVYPACNTITYDCSRCGERVSELEKEKRITTWKKPQIEEELVLLDIPYIYTIEIINDSNLHIVTDKHGTEIFQDFMDRHLSESAIRLWEEYEIYCYNDSTEMIFFQACSPNHQFNPTSASRKIFEYFKKSYPKYKHRISEITYVHNEPTFRGFIEYLKTK